MPLTNGPCQTTPNESTQVTTSWDGKGELPVATQPWILSEIHGISLSNGSLKNIPLIDRYAWFPKFCKVILMKSCVHILYIYILYIYILYI